MSDDKPAMAHTYRERAVRLHDKLHHSPHPEEERCIEAIEQEFWYVGEEEKRSQREQK